MFTQRISTQIRANCSGGKETEHAIMLRLANTTRVCQGKDVDGNQVWEPMLGVCPLQPPKGAVEPQQQKFGNKCRQKAQ